MGKEFYITADQAGRRVDRLLRTMWPQVPLGAIMKALRKGQVRLDAKKVSADTRLEEGQFLQVPWQEDVPNIIDSTISQKNKFPPLETLHRDDYVWIVNKPAGVLSQPNLKDGDSLITRALAELSWTRRDFHPATLQRLDRNTSGVVMIAMSGVALRYLSELIRERKIKKSYYAVVLGDIQKEGEVNKPLLKDSENNIVKVNENGQHALTRYKKLASAGQYSTVEIDLITGRSHQARVHMSAIGHAILGDRKYGGGDGAKRPMLHAYSITFPQDAELPENIRGKTFVAPIPNDMERFFGK